MSRVEYSNDVTRAREEAEGSDGRLNVSSRSDPRAYYNSRDEEQTFSLVWNFNAANNDEFAAYWRNASDSKTLVISAVGLNCDETCTFKLHFVTGTAAGGTELTPVNLNKSSSKAAPDDSVVMAMEGGSAATGITGLTVDGLIDRADVTAGGHEEFRLDDKLRLGQNDAVAIEVEGGDGGVVAFGVIFGYYE